MQEGPATAFPVEVNGLVSGAAAASLISALSQLAFRNLAEDPVLPGRGDPAVHGMCEQALLPPGQ